MSSGLPRFISEKEIAERKLRDAAEGKKEEPYDPRPLYDRLQAERARQQEEYEASTAFKNQIHRLDADEAAFLAKIDREKCLMQESVDQEAEQLIQEAKAANRSSLMKIAVPSSSNTEVSVRRPPLPSSSTSLNQRSLLAGIKRRPSQPSNSGTKRPHLDEVNNNLVSPSSDPNNDPKMPHDEVASASKIESSSSSDMPAGNQAGDPSCATKLQSKNLNNSPPFPPKEVPLNVAHANTTPACVLAGLLPGLEAYGDSDESSDNSDKESSSGVEDAAVILSSIAILRGKRAHEPDIGE
ncbi:PSME3-interacting protein [Taenia crassiceps]|uniref:PSME3-interacting protein n=1 Tax=Taenia crassiceps TaxID=6207 RepID=A0ABR4Q1A9_9CEST